MKPAATLGLYGGVLALVFAAAVGVGDAVGPVGTAADDRPAHSAGAGHGEGSGDSGADARPADLTPGGLAVSQDGYALRLGRSVQAPGRAELLQFEITGPDGQPVEEYEREHDEELHLIVVRRDLTGYQHLHPERDAQGRWSLPLTLAEPGPYKVFADFVPAGREKGLTLAADLTAPGPYAPVPPSTPARTSSVDGYDVSLEGDLVAGTSSDLTLSVSRDGRPVDDLEPYLAAYGHLVALRDGDLAYLHVHPEDDLEDPATEPGPDIGFSVEVPSAATYSLFLDFQHAGQVRTATFTASAVRAGGTPATSEADGTHDH